jgi:predicted esterase
MYRVRGLLLPAQSGSNGTPTNRRRLRGAAAGIAGLAMALGVPGVVAHPQSAPGSLADVVPRGQVVEHLASRANPKASYAVYLPSGYSSERKWPVVFLLDPRGRALIPIELFRPAAERLGYVLLSSYDSRSDGARAPNDLAMDAMLDDVQRYIAVDGRRLYIAGFSGTARFAWDISEGLPGALAGIIGAGAGLPGERSWLAAHVHGAPFAFWSAVGSIDPNYEEVRALDRDLASTALPHAVEYFEGPHQWPPERLCARALEWMEVEAVRRGLRPRDQSLIDSLAKSRLDELAELQRTGPSANSLRRHRAFVADFQGLVPTTSVDSVATMLARDPAVLRQLQREDELAAKDLEWTRELFGVLRELKLSESPLGLGTLKSKSRVDELRRLAGGTDSSTAIAARRGINRILVYTTFYELRDYFAGRRWEHALVLLRLADAASPGHAGVCFGFAQVYAQLGREKEALDALECTAKGKGASVTSIEESALLEPIRASPRYREILQTLRP